MRRTQALGRYGEDIAAEFLERAGMRVLARNWRCPQGEIDIVAADADCLVVCEVKTRRTLAAGRPVEAVTPVKAARLRRLTGAWLQAHEERWAGIRIDVVSVLVPRSGPHEVTHLQAVA